MPPEMISVDNKSNIPLIGLDFIGIIDRGTNIIEIKPLTVCNIRCRYCFVSAGDYSTNFIIEPNYLIEKIISLIEIKGKHDIEIHIAPYGEILIYQNLFYLIDKIKNLEGVYKISMQTNGLLLTEEIINKLEKSGLNQINISLNTLNRKNAEYLSNNADYNLEHLIDMIEKLLRSKIDVVLAPVWIPGINDKDIEEIIEFVQHLLNEIKNPNKLRLGIQKYLIYKKTGRKIRKIRPKSWGYFYNQLKSLEKKHNIKLKLGPKDFGIHKREGITPPYISGTLVQGLIVSKGRWEKEFIATLNDEWGIKIIATKDQIHSQLIGKRTNIKIIKSKKKESLLTGILE